MKRVESPREREGKGAKVMQKVGEVAGREGC